MSPTLWHVGLYSPFIVLIYFVAVHVVYQHEHRTLAKYTAATAERYPEVALRRAITGFTLAAAAVIAAGSWLPFIAKDIAELMGWGQNFVGTLLVAAVTSAPEIAVTLSALRIGAIDMAIANLLGSNLFNTAILAVADLFYANGPVLAHINSSHAFAAFTAVTMNAVVIVGLVFRPQGRAVLEFTWVSLSLGLLYILNTWILFEHEY